MLFLTLNSIRVSHPRVTSLKGYTMRLIIILLLGLATAVTCSYYIVDAKHGRSLVAGNTYDGHIYHQDPIDRTNAKWVLEPISGDPNYFFIRDTRHNKYIVAGDTYDGRIYHQLPNNRQNAKWMLVPFTDTYGSTTYHLIDQKHRRAIVAGDTADNKVYHQYPNRRPNARWALVPNYLASS